MKPRRDTLQVNSQHCEDELEESSLLTATATAAFSSGEAFGLNRKAALPAFLLSSTITLCTSSPEMLLLGFAAASIAL